MRWRAIGYTSTVGISYQQGDRNLHFDAYLSPENTNKTWFKGRSQYAVYRTIPKREIDPKTMSIRTGEQLQRYAFIIIHTWEGPDSG